MSYFSRLTDIVTCNLSELLAEADDQAAALEEIIEEMTAGVEAAQRSAKTAAANHDRIRNEIEDLSDQLKYWGDLAREEVKQKREDQARLALMRKNEVQDLIAGIKQQQEAAESTLKHLTTTLHALEARLSDAIRRRSSVARHQHAAGTTSSDASVSTEDPGGVSLPDEREQQIEDELAALKRELESEKPL